jgi:hypothetical protein
MLQVERQLAQEQLFDSAPTCMLQSRAATSFVINLAAADTLTVLMPPADLTCSMHANTYSSASAARILQLCTSSDNLL